MKEKFHFIFLFFAFATHSKSEISGSVYPFHQSGFQKNIPTSGLGADLRFKQPVSEGVQFKLETLAEKDGHKTNESFVELTNAFLEWRPGQTQVRFGWQTLTWEGTDILNLSDVINSKNYIRPLNPVARASPMIRVSHEMDSWEFDLVYIPTRSSHLYPNSKSYWLPRNRRIVIENENMEVVVPEDIEYELQSRQVLNSSDTNNIGTRIVRHSSLFDISLFAFEGANVSGTLILEGVPLEIAPATIIQLTSPVKITPIEYRQRVAGGTLTKPVFDSWIFRLSASNTKAINQGPTIDERLPKPQDAFVSSLEYSTEVFKKPTIFSVGAYEIRKINSSELALLRSVFTKAFSFSGRLEWSDNSSGLWAFVYDSIGKSSLTHGEWDYRLGSHVSLGLSFDLFGGESKTLLGSYNEFDFYRTTIKYSF